MPINCRNWSRGSKFCYCYNFVRCISWQTVNAVMLYLNFEIQWLVSEFGEQFWNGIYSFSSWNCNINPKERWIL